jgi:GTPase SAR1 family protein
MMSDIEQVDRSLAFEDLPEKVILLVGETKAGKTTLMYYLLGKKLQRWKNSEIDVFMMRPEIQFFNAYIGNNYDSTTVYPNIPTEIGEDHVMVIDLPGTPLVT